MNVCGSSNVGYVTGIHLTLPPQDASVRDREILCTVHITGTLDLRATDEWVVLPKEIGCSRG